MHKHVVVGGQHGLHRGLHHQFHVALRLLREEPQTVLVGEHRHAVEECPLHLKAWGHRLRLGGDGQEGGRVFGLVGDVGARPSRECQPGQRAGRPPRVSDLRQIPLALGQPNPIVLLEGHGHGLLAGQVCLGMCLRAQAPCHEPQGHQRKGLRGESTFLAHGGFCRFPGEPIALFDPHPCPVKRVDPHQVDGQKHQNHHRDEQQPERDGDGHGNEELRLETLVEHEGRQARDRGDGGQQDGPESAHASFPNRVVHGHALFEVAVVGGDKHQGVVHQNANEGNHAEDAEQADLGSQQPMAEADADHAKWNEAKHRKALQRRAERQDDDEQHQRENQRHDGLDAHLGLGLFAVLSFVTRADGGVFGQDAGDDVGLQICIRIAGADVGAREVRADLHLALSVQAVDRGDALHLPHLGQFLQRHKSPGRGPDPVASKVAQGASVGLGEAHPHANFVPTSLEALHLIAEEPLTDLKHQIPGCEAKLLDPGFGQHIQFLQSALVVVGDVFQILTLHHRRFQFFRGRLECVQVVAEQRHRHRPAKG